MLIICDKEKDERGHEGRVAYIAGNKIGNAPARNRAKRIMREAARLAMAPWPGYRVILVAKEGILDASLEDVYKDICIGMDYLIEQLRKTRSA